MDPRPPPAAPRLAPLVIDARPRRTDPILALHAAMPNVVGYLVFAALLLFGMSYVGPLVGDRALETRQLPGLAVLVLLALVVELGYRAMRKGVRFRFDEVGLRVERPVGLVAAPWARINVRETRAAFVFYVFVSVGFVLRKADLAPAQLEAVGAWADRARKRRRGEPASFVRVLAVVAAILGAVTAYNLFQSR